MEKKFCTDSNMVTAQFPVAAALLTCKEPPKSVSLLRECASSGNRYSVNCKAEVHTNQIIFRIKALNNIIAALHLFQRKVSKILNLLISYVPMLTIYK